MTCYTHLLSFNVQLNANSVSDHINAKYVLLNGFHLLAWLKYKKTEILFR